MKKIFSVFAVVIGLLIATKSTAQFSVVIPLAAGDTLTNTDTASKVIRITGGYSGIAITAIATELSGTSGGSIKVEGSADGTNYDIIGSAFTVTDVASQSKTFYIVAPLPEYVRVTQISTGIMSSVLTVKYRLPKYQVD